MRKIDIIKEIIEKNNGILLTSDLAEHNIPRQYLKELERQGYITKVERGIYAKIGTTVNDFFALQQRYKKGIFSHNTALYFYNLTDRTPLKLDLTFPDNIRVTDYLVNAHYVNSNIYELGLIDLEIANNIFVKTYDIERTICDIIKSRNKIDSQIVTTALKEYVKRKDKNLIKLYKYAKILRIEKILKGYMEVLM